MQRLTARFLVTGYMIQLAMFAVAFAIGHDSPLTFVALGLGIATATICTAEIARRRHTLTSGASS